MARYTIDRFEDGPFAVLEDASRRTFNVPRHWLPREAREGDVLNVVVDEPGSLRFQLDPAARHERLATARRLREKLPRGPKGDIAL